MTKRRRRNSIIGFVTIWIHLEISIAEIYVDLSNLKQDLIVHKSDNRKDMEILRSENSNNTKVILEKVDEIQIYLRNRKNWNNKWRMTNDKKIESDIAFKAWIS